MLFFQQKGVIDIDWSEISTLPLFQNIPVAPLQEVLEQIWIGNVRYDKGSFLVHTGNQIPAAGWLLEGEVHILREDFWGNRTLVARISKGAMFGETYALLQTPAEVSVQAAAPTIVCYLDLRQILQPQAMQHPALCMIACRLLQSFANRNLTLTRKIAHITCRSTRDKLLSYLSSCAQDAGSAIFSIPFDRQQLADYLSVERSAMSAELSRMKKDGLIDYHKNQFRLFDN